MFLHPSLIIGAPLTKESVSTSNRIGKMFTEAEVEKRTYDFVDVRDVALAHVLAVKCA